jgi:hypothetical protein
MFDGHNFARRLLNCFINYTEAPTYGQSARSAHWENANTVRTAKLLEHLIRIGKIFFGHCDCHIRRLLEMRQMRVKPSVGRQLE